MSCAVGYCSAGRRGGTAAFWQGLHEAGPLAGGACTVLQTSQQGGGREQFMFPPALHVVGTRCCSSPAWQNQARSRPSGQVQVVALSRAGPGHGSW